MQTATPPQLLWPAMMMCSTWSSRSAYVMTDTAFASLAKIWLNRSLACASSFQEIEGHLLRDVAVREDRAWHALQDHGLWHSGVRTTNP